MERAPGQQSKVGPGAVLDGRYRLEEQLGEGGFGAVFRATQLNLGREVALKLLRPELLANDEGRARFRREAQMAQQLEHPHTVRLYDVGETETGQPYIVWQLLRGRSLNEAVYDEGPLEPARVRLIASQVLKSLMEAHALGIVHRDIKPENICLVDFEGEKDYVKVLDFGLAKAVYRGQSCGAPLTAFGETVGTPNYMAPEQVRGRPVTARTDLYALGLVMAELLTGEMVFPGTEGLEVCKQQISSAPVPLPRSVLDSPLGPVIIRATVKDPEGRYVSASEMLQHLRIIEIDGETAARSESSSLPQAMSPGPAVVQPVDDATTERMHALPPELAAVNPGAQAEATVPDGLEAPPTLIQKSLHDEDARSSPEPAMRTLPAQGGFSWRTLAIVLCLIGLGLGGLAVGWWLAFWGMG